MPTDISGNPLIIDINYIATIKDKINLNDVTSKEWFDKYKSDLQYKINKPTYNI
jgi:hypothetical protein